MISRRDLSAGYQACQSLHSIAEFIFKFPFLSYIWHKQSNYVALLSVEDELALINLIVRLRAEKIRHSIFREPDVGNQITSICLEPTDMAHKICAGLPLALKEFKSENKINKRTFKKIT